jgi:hypothetical protein
MDNCIGFLQTCMYIHGKDVRRGGVFLLLLAARMPTSIGQCGVMPAASSGRVDLGVVDLGFHTKVSRRRQGMVRFSFQHVNAALAKSICG